MAAFNKITPLASPTEIAVLEFLLKKISSTTNA